MVVLSERSEPKDLSQMPNKPHIAPKPFTFTQFAKNTSANPLDSHSFKTKDLKPFRFTHFQKKGGGPLGKAVIPTGYLPRASEGRAEGTLRPTPPSHLQPPAMLELAQTLEETR